MVQPALGFLLQRLREERRHSLREVAQLAGIDHAYIYRLETGDKESPSEEVLTKLTKALKVEHRESKMLDYLAKHTETDPALVEYVLADKSVTFDEFSIAAGATFQGKARPSYPELIDRVRRMLKMED